MSIDVAANLAGGSSSGVVEVFWNDELIAATTVNGPTFETLDVSFQATGQLYQVLDGQLTYLDPGTGAYIDIGDDPSVRTNAIGFNMENNLIYGETNQTGTDANSTDLSRGDLIVYDANGDVFKIGAVGNSDVVGDMDTQGNL